ncbi:MAG TPA: hypothetical protein VHE78_16170 [Gemmatimonadaceae bacterium]|nr:hypothetical protein [Gemmatimonadaceae bacterium]
MTMLKGRILLGCLGVLLLSAGGARAQERLTRAALSGEWEGSLALDAGVHPISLVFRLADTSFVGSVFDGGQEFGVMEHLALAHDTVHFIAGGLDFTGVVSGKRMKMALIVFNGSTRNFDLTRRPDPPKPPSKPPDMAAAPARPLGDRTVADESRH